ncbi:MAG: hypothetical protein QOD88_3388, partial [Mycobacterium sp.]|nr:hypothetical protein [Mycobacterium sp.]
GDHYGDVLNRWTSRRGDFAVRLRARNALKSNGADSPLCSPSVRASRSTRRRISWTVGRGGSGWRNEMSFQYGLKSYPARVAGGEPLQSVTGVSDDSSDSAEDRRRTDDEPRCGRAGAVRGPGTEVTAVSYETYWPTGSLAVGVEFPVGSMRYVPLVEKNADMLHPPCRWRSCTALTKRTTNAATASPVRIPRPSRRSALPSKGAPMAGKPHRPGNTGASPCPFIYDAGSI